MVENYVEDNEEDDHHWGVDDIIFGSNDDSLSQQIAKDKHSKKAIS